jgi:hypothetical protein
MLSNEKLKEKLNDRLKKLALEPEQEDRLVREINYLSGIIIDAYLNKNVVIKTN